MCLAGALIAAVYLTRRGALQLDARPWKQDAPVSLFLLGLALAGGLLSLLAMRPDQDDVGYSSRTVYFLEHPERALDLSYHDLGLLDLVLEYPLKLAYSIEHLWGYCAYATDQSYLTVYHQWVPFLGRRSVARGLVPGRVPFRAQAPARRSLEPPPSWPTCASTGAPTAPSATWPSCASGRARSC